MNFSRREVVYCALMVAIGLGSVLLSFLLWDITINYMVDCPCE